MEGIKIIMFLKCGTKGEVKVSLACLPVLTGMQKYDLKQGWGRNRHQEHLVLTITCQEMGREKNNLNLTNFYCLPEKHQ